VGKPDLLDKATRAGTAGDLYADSRAWLGVLKAKLASFPPPPASTVIVPLKVVSAGRLVDQGSKPLTRDALKALIAQVGPQVDSLGDDAQLANVDLQNILQKQQQTLQMLSTISKLLSDTAMAVVRKIGG
jgi:hypothetical protein